jgi:hypothetical protein
MGKGAYVQIDNKTGEDFTISYDNFVEIYQNGAEGSDFTSITGVVNGNSSLPGGSATQYIEAESRVYTCSFDMNIGSLGETAVVKFKAHYATWWVENPFVKLRNGTIEIKTFVTLPGDQYAIVVAIGYSSNPENWMGTVYSKIKNSSLCLLPIPGSHDAMAYPDIRPESQAQGNSIARQLILGFRYFDFRVEVHGTVYYGVHGPDSTDHDYTSVDPNKGNKPFILDDIANFLKTHDKELVILNFSHFAAHVGENFTPEDARNFVAQLKLHFGDMLVPRAKKATVTYGECVDNYQQVVAIISDTGDDHWLAEDWYTYPANTPQGQEERRDSLFWVSSECFLDRYSAIPYSVGSNLDAKVVETLQDQEVYLAPPTPGQQGHRDILKFWVSQAVLDCNAVTNDGHSLNYWEAMKMNPLAVYVYENDWIKRVSHIWSSGGTSFPIAAPNILLMDFAGYFDGFPEACIRMLK